MGGRTPGMGGLRWPWSNAGCIAPVGGIGCAAGRAGVGWFGCLCMLGGGGGDLAMVLVVRPWVILAEIK